MTVVGLDLGTSRVKAVRFDDDWQVTATTAENTTVSRPRPGWSEQDMAQVWQAAARVLSAVARDDVSLVAITAQGDGCWLIDRVGDPVRPAILWNDNRTASIVAGWDADGTLDKAFARHGCDGAPGLASAQLRWLEDHEPERLAGAGTLLSCGSWIYYRLTGERVLHVSDAQNPFLDALTGSYDDGLLADFGLSRHRDLLPPVVAGADAVHRLAPTVAATLGLPPGIPVALAPYDVVSAAIGVGAIEPGQATAILGTTMCVEVASQTPRLSRPRNGMTLPTGESDRWLIAYATLAGTQVLDWTASILALPGAAELVELAQTVTGPDVPLLLPYLSPAGERAPFLDITARGALTGLGLQHTRADLARSAVDGLTLAVRDCLAAAGRATRIAVAGGGARSEHWCQTISDATHLPVDCPNTAETGARGAALAGSVAVGRYPNLRAAVDAAVRPQHTHHPEPDRHEYFEAAYHRLLAAREAGATHL